VTQLRKRMLEELQRHDYSQSTARIYLHVISDFAKHFRRSPDTLGEEQIRQYQLHLFHRKLSPYTIRQHTAALRFFYFKTLHRNFRAEYIPFPKFRKRLPTILSPEEVGRLIDSARNLFHRTLIMTLYSTAMRRTELCRLKAGDINSQRMMVRINQGKGLGDRPSVNGRRLSWPKKQNGHPNGCPFLKSAKIYRRATPAPQPLPARSMPQAYPRHSPSAAAARPCECRCRP